jgi:hypothetical protein
MNTDSKEAGKRSYDKATRYMENAKKELALAKKNGKFYDDTKHVSTACGTAYKSALIAIDGIFVQRGVHRGRGGVSIEYYTSNLAKIDKKMLNSLDTVYKILHIDGYYGEINNVKAISAGFEEAETFLKKLKQML